MTKAEDILLEAGFSKSNIASVKSGKVVNVKGECLTDRDLATIIAFEAKHASPDAFAKVFLESPHKVESDDTIQQMVVDMNHDGNLKFDTVKLLPKESVANVIKTYLTFKGGEELNLSEKEIAMFHALGSKATQEQVEEILAKVLQGRFEEYQQRGLEGISPYRRAKKKDYYPGKELLEKTQKSKFLYKYSKEFAEYVEAWPNGSDPDKRAKETFGWINYEIEGKPSIALYHRIIWDAKKMDGKLIMTRTFYVSIGHNSVQQFGFAVPTEDDSLLLVFSSRTSTDRVAGFGGSAKRGIGSRIMGSRIAENMEALRNLSLGDAKH